MCIQLRQISDGVQFLICYAVMMMKSEQAVLQSVTTKTTLMQELNLDFVHGCFYWYERCYKNKVTDVGFQSKIGNRAHLDVYMPQ